MGQILPSVLPKVFLALTEVGLALQCLAMPLVAEVRPQAPALSR